MPSSPSDPESETPPAGTRAPVGGPHVVDMGTLIGFGKDDDFNWSIFLVAFLIAFGMHFVVGAGANVVPAKKPAERIEMAIYTPPPPPPPPEVIPPAPEPEVKKPEPPKPVVKELPPPPPDTPPPPPPSNTPPPEVAPSEPVPVVAGISMASTVKGSGGPAVRVGNTTYGDPNGQPFVKPEDVKGYAGGKPGFKAAKASSITKEAGASCRLPPFPKELADQGVEGIATLLVKVSATGQIVDVSVARSSGNKVLDDLSIAGIKKNCTFAPGEVDGVAVDSIVRYTFRWELYD